MDVKNYNRNRKKPVRKKGLRIVAFLLLFIGVVLAVFRYYKFMSKSIYEESVSHLTEVFHQSDNMLRELTEKNLTYLHMWGENLQNTSSEDEIRDYIKKAQEDAGFLEFFFLSSDGDYKMATGETGYLGLQENIEEEIRQGNDVIANAAVPGKSQLLVFATAKAHGIYQGFEYDAIAIAYENSDIVDVLDISAFDGNAQSFIIHPDGRVVIDHSSELWGNVYNFFGFLSRHSDMSEKEINVLLEKFKAGRTDAMLLNLDGRNYYLVYEKSDIQDWMFLGLVQADIVNASMNSLQRSTILLVSVVVFCIAAFLISFIIQKGRTNLRKKDTEILYREELFQKLSMNVDDVFLMLDARTYQTDYVSPNVEKLLGITVEQIRKDICVLGKLDPENSKDSEKNYLEEIQVQEQREWDFEYVHQKTGEQRWFHNIAILEKVKDPQQRIWYIEKTAENGWSHNVLIHQIESGLYQRQVLADKVTNFDHRLPSPQSELAVQTMKDPYVFDFIPFREDMLERDIEQALVRDVTKLLLELGTGFAFMGNQYHLNVGGDDFYIDLLFYNLNLRCYVVIELKTGDFKPEYAGQLNFYLSAVDGILKKEQDNPSIGLLLCKSKNNVVAEYSLKDISKPIGVSEYKITSSLPDDLEKQLPSVEDIQKRIK